MDIIKSSTDNANSMGEDIRARRLHLGLTLSQVATMVGATKATISNIERGAKKPSLDMLERILKSLGIDSDKYIHEKFYHVKPAKTWNNITEELPDSFKLESASILLINEYSKLFLKKENEIHFICNFMETANFKQIEKLCNYCRDLAAKE